MSIFYLLKARITPDKTLNLFVNCLNGLGGERYAVYVRVQSVHFKERKEKNWESHVIVQAPKKGLSLGKPSKMIIKTVFF